MAKWLSPFVAACATALGLLTFAPVDLGELRGGWFPVTHGTINEYHLWRVTLPLIARYIPVIPSEVSSALDLIPVLIGLLLLTRTVPAISQSSSKSWIGSVAITLGLGWFFGSDRVVLGSLAWTPLLIWSIQNVFSADYSVRRLVILAFIYLLSLRSANQLSTVTTLFSFWVATLS